MEPLKAQDFAPLQVYPNPVKNVCTVSFTMENENKAEVSVYDISGKKVATLANRIFAKGENMLKWNVGNDVEAGIYFICLQSGEKIQCLKIIVE